jgi:hypothetical protein
MKERQSIRGEGNDAEERFLRHVPNSQRSEHAKSGDVTVAVDGERGCFVEIKENKKGSTINQVRAIKYITCAVWSPKEPDGWYVLPPDYLVRVAAGKPRGQHNEIAFECMNLNTNAIERKYFCTDKQLAGRVANAIRQGAAHPELADAMRRLDADLQALKARYVAEVAKLSAKSQ